MGNASERRPTQGCQEAGESVGAWQTVMVKMTTKVPTWILGRTGSVLKNPRAVEFGLSRFDSDEEPSRSRRSGGTAPSQHNKHLLRQLAMVDAMQVMVGCGASMGSMRF